MGVFPCSNQASMAPLLSPTGPSTSTATTSQLSSQLSVIWASFSSQYQSYVPPICDIMQRNILPAISLKATFRVTLAPTHHTAWHHNSDNTDIRLWKAVAFFQNLVELADKLDTQLTQGRNFMFSYWHICCACWARKWTMKCEAKAVGKQPLSETDRNGRTTLKWISGKCAMGALTKFWICYETVCHNVCNVNTQHSEEMLKTAYALESRWANGRGLFLCPTVQHAVNQQGLSTAAMAVSPRLLIADAQVEF